MDAADFYAAAALFRSCACRGRAPEHPAEAPPRPVCRQSPRCEGCPYPAHGFLCWGEGGECLRTRMEDIREGEKKDADQSGVR